MIAPQCRQKREGPNCPEHHGASKRSSICSGLPGCLAPVSVGRCLDAPSFCQRTPRTIQPRVGSAAVVRPDRRAPTGRIHSLTWVGYFSESWGRKPLLLIGFGIEIIRGVLFSYLPTRSCLLRCSCWDGLSGATVERAHGRYHHGPDSGNWPLQPGPRRCGYDHRHCGVGQHRFSGMVWQRAGEKAAFLGMAMLAAIATALVMVSANRDQAGEICRLMAKHCKASNVDLFNSSRC